MDDNREHEHDTVYGKSFALYSRTELEEFMAPLEERHRVNGIDLAQAVSGKRCLDAGCGNGRGALLMMNSGAAFIDAIDISPTNIESTRHNLEMFGYQDFQCRLSTIEKLPFDDNTFDFVWCNGVIMHTANPDACLSELSRVLKTGGRSWIYVYGTNGLYWYAIRRFRDFLADIDGDACLAVLQLLRYSVRHVAEFIDDWKTPYLRAYTAQEFGNRLRELGFDNTDPLPRGVVYDTSERRTRHPDSAVWFGQGDLRYFLVKARDALAGGTPISSSEYGSDVPFDAEIVEPFEPLFDRAFAAAGSDPVRRIAVCAYIQKALRDLLSEDGGFDVERLKEEIGAAIDYAEQVPGR